MFLTQPLSIVAMACACLLLGWQVPPARGQAGDQPYTRGVLTTVTSIDLRTSTATLQTEAGEVFEVWQSSLWRQGDTVLCDLLRLARQSRLERCRLWQRHNVAAPLPRR